VTPPRYGANCQSRDMTGPHRVVRPVSLVRGPGSTGPEQANHVEKPGRDVPNHADHPAGLAGPDRAADAAWSVNAAAVAMYRASVIEGKPLSERRLAEAFGTSSRRWARHRMAEARQAELPA
jgi:hypothetical protein